MNKNNFASQWDQIRGEAKSWWNKLTNDDLDRVEGDYESLVTLLQERYGYTHEQAVNELDSRISEFESPETPNAVS